MSDTLASIRRLNRFLRSQQRKALKKKMQPYNQLAGKESLPREYDNDAAKTTQDVIEETLQLAHTKNGAKRFSVTQTDHLLQQCNIVSPEVRDVMRAKIGMYSLMNDEVRAKLQLQAGNYQQLREKKLCELARWMVYMWCEGEGYDPEKHPKK